MPTRPRAVPAPWLRAAPQHCLHFLRPLGRPWLSMGTSPATVHCPVGIMGAGETAWVCHPLRAPLFKALCICWWFEKLSGNLSVLRAGFDILPSGTFGAGGEAGFY